MISMLGQIGTDQELGGCSQIRIMTNREVHQSTGRSECMYRHIAHVHAWVLFPPNMALWNIAL
ncbi:hypothetical protein BT93_G0523 [Corymbia citriodora subsp. variegata]|nr:hypothetical protein BT93_G0523 [Corymbia citriodora subsp. variegata]KAF8019859.1 hypothetical protein BT93_G0523 [Corymbia citriodora subsp. variegata]